MDIVDESNPHWNESKLLQLVDQSDHHIITKIYLPDQSINDSVLWSHTRDGRYMVKSGYWLASTAINDDEEPHASLATHPDVARDIWHLDIAPKLRHFLWRVTSRAIATTENLRHRN